MIAITMDKIIEVPDPKYIHAHSHWDLWPWVVHGDILIIYAVTGTSGPGSSMVIYSSYMLSLGPLALGRPW